VRRYFILTMTLAACVSGLGRPLSAQAPDDVPARYKRLFYYYANNTKLYEKALNSIGMTSRPVGRSFALIAGVTQYPNFPPLDQSLKPAQIDIEKLQSYLKDQEFFDEIVVLKDGDMNLDTLNYFLETYFPAQLKKSPRSRFLFAYSGHGYAEGSDESARGFLLTSPATTRTDPVNRIDLSILRSLLSPNIDAAEKVLVLINACQSGAFLGRRSFGPNPLGPGDRGAYAILASRKTQQSLSISTVGPGSVFFEKIFAGLNGSADKSPSDGVVTYHELDTYLHSEIPYVTNGTQIPMEGDISRDGSVGEFFFLNRNRQVQLGNSKPWNPGTAATFGDQAADLLESGRTAYNEKRYIAAVQAFGQAAEAGNMEAQTFLGYCLEHGYGVDRPDHDQARQWYEKAATAGHATAMNNLGRLYNDGSGVPQNYDLARQWYEKATALGNSNAMLSLGHLYEDSHGVPQDFQQAFRLYEQSAAAGNAHGMKSLGRLYEMGRGTPQDYEKARQLYEKSADAGYIPADEALGLLYENGKGVPKDYNKAAQFYRIAAEGGDANAMVDLGSLYFFGRGVPQDLRQARDWNEKAAVAGNINAMSNLGYIYENGKGVTRDYSVARQWYGKAAAAGDGEAAKHLKEMKR